MYHTDHRVRAGTKEDERMTECVGGDGMVKGEVVVIEDGVEERQCSHTRHISNSGRVRNILGNLHPVNMVSIRP